MHTRCRQFLLLMVDFKTQNKEEEQVKKDEPVKPKSKLKTKMALMGEGGITIRGATAKSSFLSKLRYLINKLHKEKYGSKDLRHRTLTERASFWEKYSRVSR